MLGKIEYSDNHEQSTYSRQVRAVVQSFFSRNELIAEQLWYDDTPKCPVENCENENGDAHDAVSEWRVSISNTSKPRDAVIMSTYNQYGSGGVSPTPLEGRRNGATSTGNQWVLRLQDATISMEENLQNDTTAR